MLKRIILPLVMAAIVAFPAGCSKKQSSEDISRELADKMTDSFDFEGAQKNQGKPLEGGSGSDYPQVVDYTAPSELYDGIVFKINMHSDFASQNRKIVGAQVFVENSVYYLSVPGVYSGGMLTLSGKFSWNDLFSKFTANPAVYLSFVAADVTSGSAPGSWVSPVAGLPVKWQPAVNKESKSPVSGQELTDLLTASGMISEWGTLPDDGSGSSQPSPPTLKLITSGVIHFNTDFTISAELSGDLTKVASLLLQIEGAKTNLSRRITEAEKTSFKAVVVLRFSTADAAGGALSILRGLGTGSEARAQTTYTLKAALESDGGALSKPHKLPIQVEGRPVAPDGGTVSISPITPVDPKVTAGMSISLHAIVTGAADTAVLWHTTAGTISADGIFTAPDSAGEATVTARARADQTKSSSVIAKVYAAPKVVDFHAVKESILYGEGSELHVEFEGTSADVDPGFTDVESGTALKVAPLETTTYTLIVKNEIGDKATNSASIKVAKVEVGPVYPPSPNIAPLDKVQFTAKVTGALDTGVTWSASLGQMAADGWWTAPGVEGDAVITATSTADSKTFSSTTAFVRKRTMVVSGGNHSCFMMDTGEVKCWGYNAGGQTGTNSQIQNVLSPEYVLNPTVGHLTGVKSLALGDNHTCALMSNTGVKCWGAGGNGQLGNNAKANSQVPVDVKINADLTLTGAKSIHLGANHSCAIMDDGTMRCWGANSNGQIGDGGKTDQAVAVQVMSGTAALGEVADAAAGGSHTCARIGTGMKCWGDNSYGQLGNGGKTPSSVPIDVLNSDLSLFSGSTAISLGKNHTCALMSNSGVKCWGDGTYYQLGNGILGVQSYPVDVTDSGGTPVTGFVSINAGYSTTCGRLAGSQGMCWGYNNMGQAGIGRYTTYVINPTAISDESVTPLINIKAVSPGDTHACLQHNDGAVRCWGWNRYGQLGNGQGGDTKTLATGVHSLTSGVLSVSAGGYFSCARMDDYTGKCWGRNDYGQLGDSTSINKPAPVDIINSDLTKLAEIMQLTSGSYHVCARINDTTVFCWGRNDSGQVGSNSSQNNIVNPEHVVTSGGKNLSAVSSVASGGTHSCSILNDTTVQCWGAGGSGQLGDGTTTSKRAYAAPVTSSLGGNVTSVVSLGLGTSHSCATLANKSAVCWGLNSDRQLGNGSTINANNPTGVVTNANQTPLTGAVSVAAGYGHSCALIDDATVKCWGLNSQGQLGDGTNNTAMYPVSVKVGAGVLLTDVFSIEAGDTHTCALLNNGTIWCWGYNLHGELGIGTKINSLYAVQVTGITSALSFSAGMYATCAVTAGGGAQCWGWDNLGALGDLNWSAFPLDVLL